MRRFFSHVRPAPLSLKMSTLLSSPSVSEQPADHALPLPGLLAQQQLCLQLPAPLAAQPDHQPGERGLPPMVRTRTQTDCTQ